MQQADIKYTLNYRLQQNAAHIMYRDIGRDWEQKLIPQVVLGTLKEVVGKWDAVDLIANRDKAGNTAFEQIRANLAERNRRGVALRNHRHRLHARSSRTRWSRR